MRQRINLPPRGVLGKVPAGTIFVIASRAGIEFRSFGPKRPIRCPFHEDRHASAFLSVQNVFYCSVCTPGRGLSARTFEAALRGVRRGLVNDSSMLSRGAPVPSSAAPSPTFSYEDAQVVWKLARARAEAKDGLSKDNEVYQYLELRGLFQALGHDLFGVLAVGMPLPEVITNWPARGYSIVAPLHDFNGSIVNVQARSVRNARPKTLFPTGSRAAGTVFANASGLKLLHGHGGRGSILLAEGLTDFLALGIASPVPTFSAPGTSMVTSAIGPWVKDSDLVLATDCDTAGESVVSNAAQAARGQGAKSVRRLTWPMHCKDACEVVEGIGIDGLAKFLRAKLDG